MATKEFQCTPLSLCVLIMTEINLCYHLPFNGISNFELTQLLESPNNRIVRILKDNTFNSYVGENFQDMACLPSCRYYSDDSLKSLLSDSGHDVKLLNLNIRSLDKHFGEFIALLTTLDCKFDFITISEIGKKNIANRAAILKEKYNCEFLTPQNNNFGGACIFIKSELDYHVRHDLKLNTDKVEDIWVESVIDGKKIIIGSVYRHPGNDIEPFRTMFDTVLHKIQTEGGRALISGDFNIDGHKIRTNVQTENFYNTVLMQNFLPTILLPTRITDHSVTLIDNIFMKIDKDLMGDRVVSGNIFSDISDHLPNFVILRSNKPRKMKARDERPKVRLFGSKRIDKFQTEFTNANWGQFYETTDPNILTCMLQNEYTKIFNNSFPIKVQSRKRAKDKIWITSSMRKSIKHKSELYKKYLNHPTTANKEKYKKYRNLLTRMLREAEESYFRAKINDSKKNLKALWQIYGPIINPSKIKQSRNLSKLEYEGQTLTNDKDIANALNNYFVSVGPQLSRNLKQGDCYKKFLPKMQQKCLFLHPTESKEIRTIIAQLKNNKSPGDDKISNKILKLCPEIFSKLLTHLINCIIKTGNYPDRLKVSRVVPIFKKGNPYEPSNYRPISLLSTINKIVEKVLYKRLYNFLEKHSMIYKYQFGFRHDYSTTLALIEITDQIRQEIENKNFTIGIYIDLTKAFDLVHHNILIDKLQTYGIRGLPCELLKSYLSNRKQYTVTKNVQSEIKQTECGVPQGSVLGPLLFLIYVNDIQNSVDANVRMFADDTNIFITDKNPINAKRKAEDCLKNIIDWLNSNKLLISESKTNFSVFVPHNIKIPNCLNSLTINGKLIHRTSSCKYLGIVLDDKLSFRDHIELLCMDLVRIVSSFKIIKNWVPNNQKMKLFHAYFHSKVQYGLEIYGIAAKKYIQKIQVLQNRAIKTLFNLDPMTPTVSLLATFKLLSIDDLYMTKVAKFVKKQRCCKLPSVFDNYFDDKINDAYPSTRNKHKLALPKIRTETGRKMMKYQGAKIWNNLPSALTLQQAHSGFMWKIKEYCLTKYRNQ